MPDYTDIIARNAGGSDALVPEDMSTAIIQELPTKSAAMTLMRRANLSSKTERMPVLDVLPVAYWVGGDTGMKQTSMQAWKNVTLVVEEAATIVPVPEAYLDDAAIPIWSEVQPRMVEALGALIDAAVLFGAGKPATWGTDIYTAARASGNIVQDGYTDDGTTAADDFGQTVTALGDLMSQTGYNMNGFAARPGLNWKLMGIRSSGSGVPIFYPGQPLSDGSGLSNPTLYGYPAPMIDNGAWDASKAQLLGGDWGKAIIGVRQDITFKLFTEGVISNDSGQVLLNLMQQDAVAMRLVMRLAYATVNPQTIMGQKAGKSITQRFPFGVVTTHGVS
jgi:HK97 family phage major capsid protein